jgi:hypothetical protein
MIGLKSRVAKRDMENSALAESNTPGFSAGLKFRDY